MCIAIIIESRWRKYSIFSRLAFSSWRRCVSRGRLIFLGVGVRGARDDGELRISLKVISQHRGRSIMASASSFVCVHGENRHNRQNGRDDGTGEA